LQFRSFDQSKKPGRREAFSAPNPAEHTREEQLMTHVRNLLLGTAFAAITTTAFAQTQPAQPTAPGADVSAQMSTQMQAAPGVPGVQPERPAPQELVAPASNDPLVQKRNANAQANAEYRASKKASKEELSAANKDAKAQYKEQVRNAKINRKADKAAATAELNAAEPRTPKDTGLQH
jgi:hypothetical protein